ncbi:MAG: nitrate reductase [Steroidobacteraceae bacterium]
MNSVGLLDLVRGPLFFWAFTIMIVGTLWRLSGLLLFRWQSRAAEPKAGNPVAAGLRTVALRSVPPHELEKNITFQHFTGYVWHIGWFVTLLFLGAHMPLFKSILGFAWPSLPNGVILVLAALTLGILLTLWIRRWFNPVQRLISNFDDHLSVVLTMLPIITGIAAFAHWSPFGVRYETMLAAHIISIELLMVWLPFGKIFHAVTSLIVRYRTGAAFIRRGVRA